MFYTSSTVFDGPPSPTGEGNRILYFKEKSIIYCDVEKKQSLRLVQKGSATISLLQ